MGQSMTQVLDTAKGMPGKGIRIVPYRIGGERRMDAGTITNDDGRRDGPLLLSPRGYSTCRGC